MSELRYEVVVVGRGLLGSAAARHLTELGAGVCLIGPGEPTDLAGHEGVFGSHYDSSRITRVLERDPYFARLAAASLARHRELEERTGVDFYRPVGHLSVSAMADYLDDMLVNAAAAGVVAETLDDADLATRFPLLSFGSGMTGAYDGVVGGHIDPRRLIVAQSRAVELGGGVVVDATVMAVEPTESGVVVGLDDGDVIMADKVVLATGAFANHLGIIPKEIEIRIEAHTFLFAEIGSGEARTYGSLPSVIYKRGDAVRQSVYLLPPVQYPDGRWYLKIGQSVADEMADPVTELIPWCQGSGDPGIVEWLRDELAALVPGIEPLSTHSGASIVTKSPTGRQFVDQFPGCEVYSLLADDGHVAKSSDEIGRIGAHRVWLGQVPEEYRGEDFSIVYR